MPKITDTDYFLPTIEALLPKKDLGTGRTKPMLIRGVCQTHFTKGDYVVKYRNAHEMSSTSSCRELLASLIALELELHIPPPALINITKPFTETLAGFEGEPFAKKSIGLNFGCQFYEGYVELLSGQKLNQQQNRDAQQIFAFDVFISNGDRRRDKQNMLTNGEEIIIFDHELAFGFVLDIFKNKTPWVLNEADKVWIKNHYLYDRMQSSEDNFSNFVERLDMLDKKFWSKLKTHLPKDWVTDQVDEIIFTLESIINHKDVFLKELNKVLL